MNIFLSLQYFSKSSEITEYRMCSWTTSWLLDELVLGSQRAPQARPAPPWPWEAPSGPAPHLASRGLTVDAPRGRHRPAGAS